MSKEERGGKEQGKGNKRKKNCGRRRRQEGRSVVGGRGGGPEKKRRPSKRQERGGMKERKRGEKEGGNGRGGGTGDRGRIMLRGGEGEEKGGGNGEKEGGGRGGELSPFNTDSPPFPPPPPGHGPGACPLAAPGAPSSGSLSRSHLSPRGLGLARYYLIRSPAGGSRVRHAPSPAVVVVNHSHVDQRRWFSGINPKVPNRYDTGQVSAGPVWAPLPARCPTLTPPGPRG
uniref:Uncharacterized protein n=1 Tax=Knipowitschia caucasica TaxID=637954 RepID=A0AAV2JJT1_KNICA